MYEREGKSGLFVWPVLALAALLIFFSCDEPTAVQSRSVPGSVDYCADQESIFVSPGSYDAWATARSNLVKHCGGGGVGGDGKARPEDADEDQV